MCGWCGIAVASVHKVLPPVHHQLGGQLASMSGICILQAIKNWQWERPGNEARLTQSIYSYYWSLCDVVKETSH